MKWLNDLLKSHREWRQYRMNHLVTTIQLVPGAEYLLVIDRRQMNSRDVLSLAKALHKQVGTWPTIMRVIDTATAITILEMKK